MFLSFVKMYELTNLVNNILCGLTKLMIKR